MAGKISDRELRRRDLKLSNAYDQPNIIQRRVADGDRFLGLQNIYHHQPNEKVYCCQCGSHLHKKGFTALVVTTEGNIVRMLLGSSCGAEAFGESWRKAESRMKEQYERQWELLCLDRFEMLAKPMRAALNDWHERVIEVTGRKSGLSIKLDELFSRLLEARNHHNGWLFVHRMMKLKDGKDHADTQLIAQLPGAELFNPLNMVTAVVRARDAIDMMAESLANTDGLSTATLRKRRKAFEETHQDLRTVAAIYSAAQDFYTANTFQMVASWTQRYAVTDKRYRWTGESIMDEDGEREFKLPNPFPDLSDTPLDLIAEYRRAD